MSYSRGFQLALLQETTDEMARNGCKKVLIVNGHGGNNSLLPYFARPSWKSRTITSSMSSTSALRKGGPPKKTTAWTCTPAKARPRR